MFVWVMLSFSLSLHAQKPSPDSLKQTLGFTEGVERADVLQQLARALKYEDPSRAKYYAGKALEVLDTFPDKVLKAKALGRLSRINQLTGNYDTALIYARRFLDSSSVVGDTFLIANAHNYMGIVQRYLGNHTQAVEHLKKYIDLTGKLDKRHHVGMGYNNLGNTYYQLGDYDKALEYYMKFLRIAEELRLKKDGISIALCNMALIYMNIDSFDRALDHLYRAEKVSRQVNDQVSLAAVYANIGEVLEKRGEWNRSEEYYQWALDLNKKLERQNGMASSYIHLGNLRNKQDQCDEAMGWYRKALDIYSRIEHPNGRMNALYRIGKCYRNDGNPDSSRIYLHRAMERAQDQGDKVMLRDCAHELYHLYDDADEPAMALKWYKTYDRYADSIFSEKSADNIAKWQIRYQSKQKQQRIELLETQHKLQQARISRQNMFLWVLVIGSALILFLLFLLYRVYRMKRKTNYRLSEQNKKIRAQNSEIAAQSRKLSEANEQLQKLSIVASETDNLIFLADSTGRIEWVNHAASRLYGKKRKDFEGKNLFDMISHEKRDGLLHEFYDKKESINYESTLNGANGKEYYFQTTLTPLVDEQGKIERIIAVDSDITRIKDVEKDLVQKQEELKQANATKDKFFSIISHDLKNPFNSLLGMTDLLVRRGEKMSSERVRTFHQSLHTTTRQAYELLSNLLQWSRSQLDKITVNPESFDMSVLAEQNIPLHEQRAREKGIDLINHLEGRNFPVYADYQMITTVLRNLLSNAIKFTGNGGSVSLDAVEGDGFWEFQVSDTGMGIPEERLDKLFKLGESYSAPGTDEETGTGLGLVLCKEFVDKNGGTIYAFNKKGSGSTFSFTLPKTGSNHE